MSRSRVIDSGPGRMTAIKAAIRAVDGSKIKAGVFGEKGSRTYPESGLTVAEVATINEFGTSTIPARPFLRTTFDEKSGQWLIELQRGIGRILDGKGTVDGVFGAVRARIVGDIRLKIVRGPWTPNAASTIARKGSSNPLRDTDLLLQSVDAELLHERAR